MRGFKTMNDYRTKVAGMITAGTGVVLTAVQKLTHFTVLKKLDVTQHSYLCMWVAVAGLYLMAFSREKYEDERVKKIRSGSVQIVIMLMMGMLLAISLTGIISKDLDFPPEVLMIIAAFYLIFYLIVFHIGLYYDKMWNYDADEVGIKENIKKNSWVNILFAILAVIILNILFSLL